MSLERVRGRLTARLRWLLHQGPGAARRTPERSEPPAILPPPEYRELVGSRDLAEFQLIGERFLDFFVRLGGLRPDDRVLDVGCGVGRMALPLTGYLSAAGSYDGFDIVPEAIDWCARHVTPRYPNFRFRAVDLHNRAYNPRGRQRAAEFRFPYPDGSFSFIALTSVFTHMLPEEVDHYLAEIARTARPGARCFATFYLLDAVSLSLVERKLSRIDFRYAFDGYRTTDADTPEWAVGYDEGAIRELFARHGLRVMEPIHYGRWSGREDFVSFQDIVVAVKPA